MSNKEWKHLTKSELDAAMEARQAGNEGRARVCARRAAGHVVGEYLRRERIELRTDSALDRLRFLESYPNSPTTVKTTINHFLVHMTPEHNLPFEADLISDVDRLARDLLGEELE